MIDNKTKENFLKLIESMDIPDTRREPTEPNLRWFIRNAWIRNGQHKNLDKAMDIAKKFS